MQPTWQFSSCVCMPYACQEKDEEDTTAQPLPGQGLWSQHLFLAGILQFLIKALFPLSRGITRVPCLLLVYFHKNLENLLFLRTSVEASLTAPRRCRRWGRAEAPARRPEGRTKKTEWDWSRPREKRGAKSLYSAN